MRHTALISVVTTLIAWVLLQACKEPRNFDDEIRTVDSLHRAMEEILPALDSSALKITDSITSQLMFIQTNFKGEINETMARSLLRYGDLRNKEVMLDEWKDSLHYRKDKLENELYAFRNTLADKATHDRRRQEITELYADSIVQRLTEKQQQWHAKVNEWIQKQTAVYNQWQLTNDTILIWRNTIPQRKKNG